MIKKLAGKLVGKRTIATAIAKMVVAFMGSKGWLPEGMNNEATIVAIQEFLTGLMVWFLALKGNRMISGGSAQFEKLDQMLER